MQLCLSTPLPPYFGLSKQYLHDLHSAAKQLSQVPQRFRFLPMKYNYTVADTII